MISRFNEGYYCEIVAVTFKADSIAVHIDEHGDYSMGKQRSQLSSLGVLFLCIAIQARYSTPITRSS